MLHSQKLLHCSRVFQHIIAAAGPKFQIPNVLQINLTYNNLSRVIRRVTGPYVTEAKGKVGIMGLMELQFLSASAKL